MQNKTLLQKPFWRPQDLSDFTGISVHAARKIFKIIRDELENKGYSTLPSLVLPSKTILERLNVDINYVLSIGE